MRYRHFDGFLLRLSLLACLAVEVGAQGAPTTNPALARGEARQVPDTAFVGRLSVTPHFAAGRHPVVVIDEAHSNFHTAIGRYRAFAQLLEADGITVNRGTGTFAESSLAKARVLVIANALHEKQMRNTDWRLPAMSAFTGVEITAVVEWVRGGGSLLLIADHMPFAGAATELALPLGIHFANGYAIPGVPSDEITGDYPIIFRAGSGGLGKHEITSGRKKGERIDSIASFTGSAFWIDSRASSTTLMRLPAGTRIKLPVEAWKFSDSTAELPGDGVAQGAVFQFGKGRVAVFGEAAMFSAQLKGAQSVTMGMNAPIARQNPQFVLNVIHWLLNQ